MIGKRLAQYEILDKIGQGGMGEVWRARDTTLDREVAIKILPEAFAGDAERLARFEREAKLLASLNHGGIAAIHGLHVESPTGEPGSSTVHFLAMEFVPGENLAQRLERGPLGLDEALFVGVQVAEALEAAHAQGVVHRDLKPANIVLTPDGKAKVLDFGLAKATETDASGSSTHVSMSPTATSAGTVAGVILGTAAYMSPEQARGKPLDRRTDIWAFGCVLFESLTAHRMYGGESVSDSLGAILHKEPDWSKLPPATPPTVLWLLRRCLTKDADKRLHDIADARIELEHAIEDPSGRSLGLETASGREPGAGRPGGGLRPWIVAAVAVTAIAVGLAAGWLLRGDPPDVPLRKFDLGMTIETDAGAAPDVALSRDGSRVAFTYADRLWVHSLDAIEARPLDGTDGATAPFWSPDGEDIGYFGDRKLWKIPAVGGRAVAIADMGGPWSGGRGGSWGDDGQIVYARGDSGLFRVSSLGGDPKEILAVGEGEGDLHQPHLLPDGGGMLFVVHPSDDRPGVLTLLRDDERTVLLDLDGQSVWNPEYSPTGHIVFRRTGSDATSGVWALPFSLGAGEVTGEPFLVAPDAGVSSVSPDGSLAYVHRPPTGGGSRLTWVDRNGRPIESIGDYRGFMIGPTLSPDGRRVAFVRERDEDRRSDVWIRDLERETEARLTEDPTFKFNLRWTPSADTIVYGRFDPDAQQVALGAVATDGSGEPRVVMSGAGPADMAPDGRHVLAFIAPEGEELGPTGDIDFGLVALEGGEEPQRLISGIARGAEARFSPDGRWLAFGSDRSGRTSLYLTRYPDLTGRWQIASGDLEGLTWDPRGDRMYFVENNAVFEVRFDAAGGEPRLGKATELFPLPAVGVPGGPPGNFDVSNDGERFVLVEAATAETDAESRSGIKVVQNWIREFRP